MCVCFGLRTGADVLGVLYLVSECILHLDREVFGILDWEVFGKSLHVFGILDWEVYCSEESSAARGKSSSDGGEIRDRQPQCYDISILL